MEMENWITLLAFILVDSHWWRDENNAVTADEQEGNRSLGGFVHFFVGFFIDLDCCDCFFCSGENHVEMLVESLDERRKIGNE